MDQLSYMRRSRRHNGDSQAEHRTRTRSGAAGARCNAKNTHASELCRDSDCFKHSALVCQLRDAHAFPIKVEQSHARVGCVDSNPEQFRVGTSRVTSNDVLHLSLVWPACVRIGPTIPWNGGVVTECMVRDNQATIDVVGISQTPLNSIGHGSQHHAVARAAHALPSDWVGAVRRIARWSGAPVLDRDATVRVGGIPLRYARCIRSPTEVVLVIVALVVRRGVVRRRA